jgi:hypothetical protein
MISKLIASVVVVTASFGVLAPVLVSAGSDASTSCAAEPYQWTGQTVLAAGESFDTGVAVPAQDGTQLVVSAVDYSSDPVVAGVVAVSIGGASASGGATVQAGDIAATNTSSDSLTVTVVAVNIDRCHQVASEAPTTSSVSAAPTGLTSIKAKSSAVLPVTGQTSVSLVVAALGLLGAGGLLVLISARGDRSPRLARSRAASRRA